jgi:hypothetical protein
MNVLINVFIYNIYGKVSSSLHDNASFIYHPTCSEFCPEQCDMTWKVSIPGYLFEKDDTLKIACSSGKYYLHNTSKK